MGFYEATISRLDLASATRDVVVLAIDGVDSIADAIALAYSARTTFNAADKTAQYERLTVEERREPSPDVRDFDAILVEITDRLNERKDNGR